MTELAAGPAKVTLSEQSTSFFDEYLDEIVYFFQNSKTTVVIFEDLDRFSDPHIFETLRELNLLLNNAEQTGTEPIRFVYAIRDSIFEQLDEDGDPDEAGAVSGETRRLMATNRTKFFDLVIPIVPFISHKTSRDLIRAELTTVPEAQRPSVAVIDLVSAHLTDMRLIKNICNEYDVFRRRILRSDGLEGLTADRLFASMVYKNVYLGDYEKIRNGTSLLDELYRAYRDWVSFRAASARERATTARGRLHRVSQGSIGARSQRLGKRLQDVLMVYNHRTLSPGSAQVHLAGTVYPWAQLAEPTFWRNYLADPQDLGVVRGAGYGIERTIPFDDVQTLIGEQLNAQDWSEQDRAQWRAQMTNATTEERTVSHAPLTAALEATDKTFVRGGEEVALIEVARKLFDGADVVIDLLRDGYIDENFTLYVTQFPGQGSASAMNFILKAVQPNVMDIEYRFGAADDIQSVLAAEGDRLLEGKSVFNIQLFDHLLATDSAQLSDPIRRLARAADSDKEFLAAYLQSGQHKAQFATMLSGSWAGLIGYLLSDQSGVVDAPLLSAALLGADPDDSYEINAQQREAFAAVLPHMTAVTAPQSPDRSRAIAVVLQQLGVKVDDLGVVAQPVRSEVVALGLYAISRSNIRAILGGDDGVPLDVARTVDAGVYEHLLAHLPDYLRALSEAPPLASVINPEQFQPVLVDVARVDDTALFEVANRANDSCMVRDLSAFDSAHWPIIARAHRLHLSVPSSRLYLGEHGFDAPMVEWLSTARQFEVADSDEDRAVLAKWTLNAQPLNDDVKLLLVESLQLGGQFIAASDLKPNAHSLLPTLVSRYWVADNADAFTCLGEDEWPIKQALINASTGFPEYLPTLTLSAVELRDLARAPVPDAVKDVLLGEYQVFEQSLATNGALALANWAATRGRKPTANVIVSLAAKAGAQAAGPIVKLLGEQAGTIDLESLRGALDALGNPYAQLTRPGRRQPKPPIIDGMEAVLTRLQRERIVSKFEPKPRKGLFEVYKRYS